MQLALVGGILAVVVVAIFAMRRATERSTPEETRLARAALSQRLAANRLGLGLAVGGAAIALTGAGMFVHALASETLEIELASLEAGEEAGSSFVRVRGLALGARSVCRRSGSRQTCYTPLVTAADRTRIAVLLSSGAALDGEGTFSGFAWSDVPSDLPPAFEDELGLDVTGALMLRPGETPEERRPIGLTIAAAGAAVAAAGALMLRRRAARS